MTLTGRGARALVWLCAGAAALTIAEGLHAAERPASRTSALAVAIVFELALAVVAWTCGPRWSDPGLHSPARWRTIAAARVIAAASFALGVATSTRTIIENGAAELTTPLSDALLVGASVACGIGALLETPRSRARSRARSSPRQREALVYRTSSGAVASRVAGDPVVSGRKGWRRIRDVERAIDARRWKDPAPRPRDDEIRAALERWGSFEPRDQTRRDET